MTSTILIVDDEPIITTALKRTLGGAHRVIAVNDPYEAIEVIEREPIDLVITDKDMPQMSGHMLLDMLHDGYPDVPCVMLTGTPSLQSAMVALNGEQVIRYLSKPWSPRELEETVAAGLVRRAALIETSAARQAERARAALVAALTAQEPDLAAAAAAPYRLEVTPLGEAIAEAVRALQVGAAIPNDLDERVQGATPAELARALASVPVRNAAVGVLITAAAPAGAIDLDIGGRALAMAALPRELADLTAARLALQAGIGLATDGERLGRLVVDHAGASAQLLVAYHHHGEAGATLEMRRVVVGAEATGGATPMPTQVDRYKLLAPVGSGGMGTVYRAVHRDIGRTVAIKVLRSAYAHDPITNARFVREARAAVRARHPRIVETYDFGQLADGCPYLVMELVESETLRARIARGPVPPLDAIAIARGIAEALGAAHAVDIVHRDLKPANIFVGDGNDVKLADFGAAKMLDDAGEALTGTGVTLGTPYYMAPEQITGMTVDGRSDLYALGCVLHEMLTGTPPFRGKATREVLVQHLHAQIPTPESPHGAIAPALTHVVRTAMAKSSKRRYQTAAELIADLDVAAQRQAAGH